MEEQILKTVTCPDCENGISVIDGVEDGDILVCEKCGVELEIINTDPIEVDYLYVQK
ncbi:lysine biosynthesis protein LysW [candidate division WWE3 bacterium CG_4_9_14_3_um_filter_41_6]|uniref:Lysine biosynthesis protein LysW n=1 Tax=candidate division WWE3 bacterium CG_4_10_14_0_2_um_filter_41_14 TaxID=1975072 RepID=A0A2M7THI6_UNCKA|nr:MAG: lysine biosynthesis protein LysW [candidate division WWE3 bacterium CG_4_10_14_0_2_um_filter_41_14]PJA39475.1 MAG: lysine biosynthesis protein LysW [candidate division WWE3 bacterium CG_4_9_14_3_um_filter_41_6]